MDSPKISSDLALRRRGAHPDEVLDVVVELVPAPPPQTEPGDRAAVIAARKQAFATRCAEVEQSIVAFGGTVVDQVWLNETLRVRLPAGGVDPVAALDSVALLDVPHPITPE